MNKNLLFRTFSAFWAGTLLMSAFPAYATADNSIISTKTMSAGEPDYILGRPMTDEEIAEQKQIASDALKNSGYLPLDQTTAAALSADEAPLQTFTDLPDSYDSRKQGIVTEVGNQNPYGTCWAFTAISLIESNLLKKGYTDYTNLSEAHLAYYAGFSVPEPLGNQYLDFYANNQAGGYENVGGNCYLSFSSLAAWRGAVSENTIPYQTIMNKGFAATTEEAYGNAIAHLQGFYRFSSVEEVKEAIMEYGAVGAGYYHDPNDNYYNYDTAAYYYSDGYTGMNHAITIIGWDDHYKKENFPEYGQPSSDGAWILKNSWGTAWGDEGYFYISYEDQTLGDFYAFDAEPADTYDNCYQYDLTSNISPYWVDVQKAASVFTVKANSGKPEQLKAVSIAMTMLANNEYAIQIYKNPTNAADPTSGTPLLSKPQTGNTVHAGYYTIPLEETVILEDGDTFSVVFTFPSYTFVDCEISTSVPEGYVVTASSKAGESYIYLNNSWSDIGKDGTGNLRIKAFTSNLESITNDTVTDPFESNTYRISGRTRYETSLAIADALKESYSLKQFSTVIIASGNNFPDALAGSYLAKIKEAPILMYNNKSGQSNIASLEKYIKEHLTSEGTIYILGGPGAVSNEIETTFSKYPYRVVRLGGTSRYDTNLRILSEAQVSKGDFLVCTAQDFSDSLSCSAVGKPILLVDSKTKQLTEAQKVFLSKMKGSSFYIIGGTNAVSDSLKDQLAAYGSVDRIGGTNRYETSVMVAEKFFDQPNQAVLAYAKTFPDGLCGGSFAISRHCPLILTKTKNETAAFNYMKSKNITQGVVLGGDSLIDNATTAKLFQLNSEKQIKEWK